MMICLPATRRTKTALLAGCALAVVACAGAKAQPVSPSLGLRPPPIPVIVPPPPDDGLKGGGFYLEADELTQDNATHHVTATGSVEARYNGRTLRAQSLDYDSET